MVALEEGTMKMRVRDQEIDVEVRPTTDGLRADFVATLDQKVYRSETWAGLYKTLMAQTKRVTVKVRVPFLRLLHENWNSPNRFSEQVAVGIHGGTGKVLVKDEKARGGSSQDDGYSVVFVELTPAEQQQRIELEDRLGEVQAQIKEFDSTRTFRLAEKVRNAIEEEVNKDG